MLISFTESEVLKLGRGMAQRQEGLMTLFEYLERAYPAAAMNSVKTSGDQSEKFKGFAMCLEALCTDLSEVEAKATELTGRLAVPESGPGHVLIT